MCIYVYVFICKSFHLACIKMLSKHSLLKFWIMMLNENDLSDFESKFIIGKWMAGTSFMKSAPIC